MDIAQREQMEALAEKERKQEVATSNKLKFRKREKVCHIFAVRLVKFMYDSIRQNPSMVKIIVAVYEIRGSMAIVSLVKGFIWDINGYCSLR